MKIVIANDHGALELKNEIVVYLKSKGHEVVNLGVDSNASCDYPDMAEIAVKEYRKGGYDFGILLCGNGDRYIDFRQQDERREMRAAAECVRG
jgi:ribose 5-phosphate isomerase B